MILCLHMKLILFFTLPHESFRVVIVLVEEQLNETIIHISSIYN